MLTDMTLGQYYPGDSFLHRMDPRAKILCTMIFIIAIFLANNPFSYLLVAAFTLGAISVSGVPYKLDRFHFALDLHDEPDRPDGRHRSTPHAIQAHRRSGA